MATTGTISSGAIGGVADGRQLCWRPNHGKVGHILDTHEKLLRHEEEPDLENLPAHQWQPGKFPSSGVLFCEEGFSRDGGVGKHELLHQVIQSEQQGRAQHLPGDNHLGRLV